MCDRAHQGHSANALLSQNSGHRLMICTVAY